LLRREREFVGDGEKVTDPSGGSGATDPDAAEPTSTGRPVALHATDGDATRRAEWERQTLGVMAGKQLLTATRMVTNF